MARQGREPAEAGGGRRGAWQQNPRTNDNALMTIALKPETYGALAELKARYRFKSFDDVVKLLLQSCGGQ